MLEKLTLPDPDLTLPSVLCPDGERPNIACEDWWREVFATYKEQIAKGFKERDDANYDLWNEKCGQATTGAQEEAIEAIYQEDHANNKRWMLHDLGQADSRFVRIVAARCCHPVEDAA